MSKQHYLIGMTGTASDVPSAVFGRATPDGARPIAMPLKFKDAQALAETWPIKGHIVIYKLVPVRNVWRDPESQTGVERPAGPG